MNPVVYSAAGILSISDDSIPCVHQYSDRSFVELHGSDCNTYILRAIDIDNNKQEIFNIPLTRSDIYIFGPSENYPDEIRFENTRFRLFLNPKARDRFHQGLKECLAKLDCTQQTSAFSNRSLTDKSNSKITPYENEILANIHKLNKCIENGDANNAAYFTSKLASQRIQLKAEVLNEKLNDEKLQIRVKLDGISLSNKFKNKEYNLSVYKSTTIHELRVLFQHIHNFPLEHQYFFIDGHLAYAQYTMNDLNAQDNAFFILFITEQESENF
ncbi:unnamed protein product [Adineta steineri]|uniref:Ubiquitin-like domain-containing protein n=1 Tax=Adineta steineri TaxID=433720 RepID=A0A814B7Q1_9BILA|nr:unnamed protein product [Adineta steineri]CAF4048018.1 unnamed protein product [Adineta steineri]